ncbi:MAG: thioredoxin family protein [Dysgonomonas sp.]
MNIFRIKSWHILFVFGIFIFLINIFPIQGEGEYASVKSNTKLTDLDMDSFKDSISSGISYVLFYKENSTICNQMDYNLNKLIGDSSKAKFYKLDLTKNTFSHDISGVPYTMIFKDGKLVEEIFGVVPVSNLRMINNRVTK